MVEIQLLDNGVQTLTTVDVSHPQLIPGGLFEYQHSTGDDVEASVKAGFESWESVALAVLLDALRPRPAFCTCCFLTRNFEAFRGQMEGDGHFGIRFYAMRNQDGEAGADCRINGEDYEPGIVALRSYANTWPGSGFEFRKQYVFVYTPAPTS